MTIQSVHPELADLSEAARSEFKYLVERYRHDYGDYPDFLEALRVLVRFLVEEVDSQCRWHIYVFCTDGADKDEQGRPTTDGWAFALLSSDTTSYIHTEDGGHVQWLGTSWVPGCECDDPPDDIEGYSLCESGEHLPGCPAAMPPHALDRIVLLCDGEADS
jgi:hypothetical protein